MHPLLLARDAFPCSRRLCEHGEGQPRPHVDPLRAHHSGGCAEVHCLDGCTPQWSSCSVRRGRCVAALRYKRCTAPH